jgi:hypothetical protein
MTMDQQLFEELYGTNNPEGSDEQIKEAQAELIEAVADEAGINLNELDDGELDKFAEYCLTPEGSEQHLDPNLATADAMGRQMAHSYAEEQIKIASHIQGETMIDDILFEKAAQWEMAKEAAEDDTKWKDKSLRDYGRSARTGLSRATGYRDIVKSRELSKMMKDYKKGILDGGTAAGAAAWKAQKEGYGTARKALSADQLKDVGVLEKQQRSAWLKAKKGESAIGNIGEYQAAKRTRKGLRIRGGLKAGATAGALGAIGYGAHRMSKRSSYDPAINWIEELEGMEFAKLAEFRACEILAANGVDPSTFEECSPEHIKVANFPEPDDAVDYDSAAQIEDYNDVLDDAALDILDELGLLG